MNDQEICKGISPVTTKVGERLFDEKLTAMDAGTIDGRFPSASYDDEGVPRRCNVLVEKGVGFSTHPVRPS